MERFAIDASQFTPRPNGDLNCLTGVVLVVRYS